MNQMNEIEQMNRRIRIRAKENEYGD